MNDTAASILDFWFGDAADGDEKALQAAFKRWFSSDASFDRVIETRFGECVEKALAGGLREWEAGPRERLALILLLDQFPRNIHRGTGHAFAGDERALRLSQQAVSSGMDVELSPIERVFLLMPMQHAEDRGVQRESVERFSQLANTHAPPHVRKLLNGSLDYARQHREIVEKFGRFPYRNEALGREDTAAEREWLASSNERFGQ